MDIIKSKFNKNVIITSDKYEKLLENNNKLNVLLEEYEQFIKGNN